MGKRPKRPKGWSVSPCSACEHVYLTLGEQWFGGVRYCIGCLPFTLAWHQMTPDEQAHVRQRYHDMAQRPETKAALEKASTITPDQLKAVSIGESRYRLMTSEIGS